jgi:hypothetical protein
MKFFGFRFARTTARPPNGGQSPKSSGVLKALSRSPLLGADFNPTREKRWDDFFKNGPRVTDDFMNVREQPPAEQREPF